MTQNQTLFDGTVKVGAGKVRTLDLPYEGHPVRVFATWAADGASVRALILEKGQLRLWLQGKAHTPVALGEYGWRGNVQGWLIKQGDFVLALDNLRNRQNPAEVHLNVRVLHGDNPDAVQFADPVRGQALVWTSVFLFGAICLYAGVRISRAMRRRFEFRE